MSITEQDNITNTLHHICYKLFFYISIQQRFIILVKGYKVDIFIYYVKLYHFDDISSVHECQFNKSTYEY